jgi:hypothetical protein
VEERRLIAAPVSAVTNRGLALGRKLILTAQKIRYDVTTVLDVHNPIERSSLPVENLRQTLNLCGSRFCL